MNHAFSLRATAAFVTLHKPADFDQLFSMMLVPSNPGLWALAKGQGVWRDKRFVIKLMPLKSSRIESKGPHCLTLRTCGHWNLRQHCRGQSRGSPALRRHAEAISLIRSILQQMHQLKNQHLTTQHKCRYSSCSLLHAPAEILGAKVFLKQLKGEIRKLPAEWLGVGNEVE